MTLVTKLDIAILNFIQDNLKSENLDKIMTSITALGNMGIFWILLILVFLSTKEYRKMGKIMVVALLINTLIVNIMLKPLFDRIRPFEIVDGIKLLVLKPTDPSFPSGHAAVSFCMLTVILIFSKSKTISIMSTILTFLIAFSRLYLYVHYPSDVIIGSIIGIFCASLAIKIFFSKKGEEIRKKIREVYGKMLIFKKL